MENVSLILKLVNDNECFKFMPADHHPARIRKVDKMFESELDFTGIKVFKRYSQNSKKELHQRQYF